MQLFDAYGRPVDQYGRPLPPRRPPQPPLPPQYGDDYYENPPESKPSKANIFDSQGYELRPYFSVETETEIEDFIIPVEFPGVEFIFALKDGSKVVGLMRHPKTLEHVKVEFIKEEPTVQTDNSIDTVNQSIQALKAEVDELKAFKALAEAMISSKTETKSKPEATFKKEGE